jgi:hypothetical protein
MNKLREYRKTISFTIAPQKIKYLRVNLMKDINNLYKENYKPLKKEIEEGYRRSKDLPCSWIGRLHTEKNVYTTESNLHVQCNTHQNSNDIHHRD